jgi:cytochrome c
MDSDTFNWIAMAVLSALLLVFGMPVMLEIMHGGGKGKQVAKAGYKLPDATGSAGSHGGAAPVKKGFEFKNVAALLEGASVDAGKAGFKKCSTCHTVNEGGKNGQGPNLYDIVGRDRASVEGFKFSKAMIAKGGAWDYETLAAFIHKPKKWLKGTRMAFQGLKSNKDLANMLAYLRSLSASPKPYPKVE